jgi:hypothetical protein
VEPEADEPAFHARWEAQVFALMRAAGAAGAYAYGWYIAVLFVPLWRFFNRRGRG